MSHSIPLVHPVVDESYSIPLVHPVVDEGVDAGVGHRQPIEAQVHVPGEGPS